MARPATEINATADAEKRIPGELKSNWIIRCNVRTRRKALGITQSQLARLLGVSVPHVCHLERGRNISEAKIMCFSLEVLEAAAQALSCEPFDLLMPNRFSKS